MEHIILDELYAILQDLYGARDGDGVLAQGEGVTVHKQDIFVQIVHMGYGKGGINPVSHLTTAFYEPVKQGDEGDSVSAVSNHQLHVDASGQVWRVGGVPADAVSRILPSEYEEVYVRVYSRFKKQSALLKRVFLKVRTVPVSWFCCIFLCLIYFVYFF